MRRILLIATLALSVSISACANQSDPESSSEPAAEGSSQMTVDALVQKHVEATGGRERLLSLTTMQFSAKNAGGGEVDAFTVYRKRPNLFRKEAKKGDKVMIKAFDGKVGWSQEGSEKAAAVPEDKRAMMQKGADFDDAMIDYDKKGHKVELLGQEDVRGAKAYKIRLTLASGDVELRYIDARSFLEVKRSGESMHEGKKESWSTYFTDYKPVDGIPLNHGIEVEHDGTTARYVIESAAYDRPLDASLFQLPDSAAAQP